MAREHMPEGPGRPPFSEVKRTEKAVSGGSTAAMLAGLAAVVLVILSFIGVLRIEMAAVATILIGVGLMLQGLAVTRRHDQIREELAAAGNTKAANSISSGMTVEFIAGIIGIVLGAIALFGGAPYALMAIAVIVYGVALIMGGQLTNQLDDLNIASARIEGTQLESSRKVVRTASGLEVLVGIAAAVLGILVLIAFTNNIMLILVALFLTGASLAFSGGVIAKRSGAVS